MMALFFHTVPFYLLLHIKNMFWNYSECDFGNCNIKDLRITTDHIINNLICLLNTLKNEHTYQNNLKKLFLLAYLNFKFKAYRSSELYTNWPPCVLILKRWFCIPNRTLLAVRRVYIFFYFVCVFFVLFLWFCVVLCKLFRFGKQFNIIIYRIIVVENL